MRTASVSTEETYEKLFLLIDRIEVFMHRDIEAAYEPHHFQEHSPTSSELIVTYTNGA